MDCFAGAGFWADFLGEGFEAFFAGDFDTDFAGDFDTDLTGDFDCVFFFYSAAFLTDLGLEADLSLIGDFFADLTGDSFLTGDTFLTGEDFLADFFAVDLPDFFGLSLTTGTALISSNGSDSSFIS